MSESLSLSPESARRRPCNLRMDGGSDQRITTTTVTTSVDRLLTDITFQWQREQQRATAHRVQHRQQHRDDGHQVATMAPNDYDGTDNDEAASAYWWTDVFLRYFVFDTDSAKQKIAADSDDLLFFVRRRRRRHKCKRRRPSSQRRRRVAYDTRAYRKQQKQQTTLLPVGDPAVLWRHTVCLNTIVHRLQYTLTVAVCVRVPRKSVSAPGVDYYYDDNNTDEFGFDDGQDQGYDLQVLSRHVHTVYASTSGRRMDAAKGPRERPVYPAVCWAADDYAEAFRTVIVHPGQTVCAELVATWPSSVIADEYVDNDRDDYKEYDRIDYSDCDFQHRRIKSMPANLEQNQNRAVLFAGAVPYAAVRAAYECKMSLYREAERQQRKWRKQQRKHGSKKSSLGAALSASLTALFTSGKDSTTMASSNSANYEDYDYYYGPTASSPERVEYVTVRGCRPGCDDDQCDLTLFSDTDFNKDIDNISTKSDDYSNIKGLAQMAVTLASVQSLEMITSVTDCNDSEYNRRYNSGDDIQIMSSDVDDIDEYDARCYDDGDYTTTPVGYQHHLGPSSYAAPATASEPGDYYDYGWDYETAASSGHQTPQTPVSYHYQQQQQQQLERQRRSGGRPRRLSDPCSTSVYDMIEDNYEQQSQYYAQQQRVHFNNIYGGSGNRRKQQHQQYNYQQYQQQQLSGYGSSITTPVKTGYTYNPHRAWSESDGLNRCGGDGDGIGQQKRLKTDILPPPPVPYYCATEAAASGFIQYARKSPGGWWTRMKNRRRRRRARRNKRKQKSGQTVDGNRRRSASAGCNRNGNGRCTTTDDDDSGDSDSDNGGTDGNNDTDSDDQDSDGEFIGALAAAAAVGHDPNCEWSQRGVAGDPVAAWDRYDSADDSDTVVDDCVNDNNGFTTIEWTTEIIATDLRCKRPYRNVVLPSRATTLLYNNDINNWCDRTFPMTPVSTVNRQQQQHQQQFGPNSRQQNRQRRPLPQLRPQPLEPPPPPPALSVAFTAVACPWWTVLEDVMFVNTKGGPSSSNKIVLTSPLLTFN